MLSASRAGCCCAIGVMAIASFHTTAGPAPMPPEPIPALSGPLNLERALELTSRYELRLRAAGLRAEAARSRMAEANRRPNPTLTAAEENFGGQLGGLHREASLVIGQTLELGGDRKARMAAAEAEYRLATAEAGVLGREGLALTADRFMDAWSLQTRLGRLKAGELLSEQAVLAATARHRAGASPRLEILRAQSQAMSQAVERQRTESELRVARRELALCWGAGEATFDSLVAPERTMVGATSGWQSWLTTHPALKRALAGEALAAARVQAAGAARVPDLAFTGGVRRLEEVPGTGFLVGVELPLPLWSKGAAGIAAARHELEGAVAERRATQERLRVERAAAIERLESATAVYDTLRMRVHPAREQIVQELLLGYRSGRSGYLDLVAEQRNLLETELALIDAQADLWRARVRLELLAGAGLLVPKEER